MNQVVLQQLTRARTALVLDQPFFGVLALRGKRLGLLHHLDVLSGCGGLRGDLATREEGGRETDDGGRESAVERHKRGRKAFWNITKGFSADYPFSRETF